MWYQDPEWKSLVKSLHRNLGSALHKGICMDWLEERSIDIRTLPHYDSIYTRSGIGLFHRSFSKPNSDLYSLHELLSWYPVDIIYLVGVAPTDYDKYSRFCYFDSVTCVYAEREFGIKVFGISGSDYECRKMVHDIVVRKYLGV